MKKYLILVLFLSSCAEVSPKHNVGECVVFGERNIVKITKVTQKRYFYCLTSTCDYTGIILQETLEKDSEVIDCKEVDL